MTSILEPLSSDVFAGRYTALGAVEECLRRIEKQDGAIQSFVAIREEAARDEARQLDESPDRGPLHGIPFAVKDIFETESLPTEYNSALYRGYQADRDASVVAQLRRAGAVFLGKVSTVEFAGMGNSPATRNPHRLTHSPGGSSAGSGAAVGAGMVPLAIGSQTGGSTIRPAAFCGVIGFKPTWGLVSCEGMKPFAPSLDTVGFIGDSIELMSRVLMSTASLRETGDALDNQLDPATPLRIGVYRTRYVEEASVDVLAALDGVTARLAEAGHVVTEVEDPFNDVDINALQDVVMWGEAIEAMAPELASSYDRLSGAVVSALETHRHISKAEIVAAKDTLASLRPLCDEAMKGLDAWLTPAVPGVAPLMEEGNGVATFNRLFTALHVPCLTFPAGWGADDLPLGLQLVGPRGGDGRLIRVVQAVHQLISESRFR